MSIGTGDIIDDAMTAAKISLDSVYIAWQERDTLFKRNAISFDPTINLSNNAGKSGGAAVATSGYPDVNNVYVMWPDNSSGYYDILYRRSTDGGASFGGTVNISNTTGSSYPAALAADGNRVYVVWADNSSGNSEILYSRSTDRGVSFGSAVNISNTTGYSSQPAVAASGQNVYVVWIDNSLGNFDILHSRSTDGGASFGGAVNISNTPGDSQQPAIAAFGDIVVGQYVYVVWADNSSGNSEILYSRSTNGGASFGGAVNISNTPGSSRLPAIAVSGQNVYIVWDDNNNILFIRSTDGGASFGSTVRFQSGGDPAVAASGYPLENNVYFVWTDNSSGNSEILYSKSTNGGVSFGRAVNISNTPGNSGSPCVAVSNNLNW